MHDVEKIIEQCLESCKPPVQLYAEDDDGGYHEIGDKAVADIALAVERLQLTLKPFLKDEKEQGEIDLLKSENAYLIGEINAYEKFLKRNGIIDAEESGEQNG